jgi:uncharacterized protein (DUF58 family)
MVLFPRIRGVATPLRQQAEAAAARLPALLVAAERVAATVAQGAHGRRRVGQGEAFWQFRPYSPGDPTPRIDWRQTARRDGTRSAHTYVRDPEWEAAQSVFLWRDGSASMDWRSDPALPRKADRAGVLLIALALLLARGGERIGLLGSPERPSPGRVGLDRLIRHVEAETTRPGTTAGLPPRAGVPRRAHLVLIGDFLGPVEETRAVIAGYVARECVGHLVQVLDPAEEDLPYAGRVRFEGPEREASTLVSRAEELRDAYRDRLQAHRAALAQIAGSAGWRFTTHRTDHPPATALLALWAALSDQV